MFLAFAGERALVRRIAMPRISVEPEAREFIAERIARFKTEAPQELQWQTEYVRTNQALPLYIGWTETFAIRPDGDLVRWSTEGEWPGVRPLDGAIWINSALVQGAKRYPQLKSLIPDRSTDARTCDDCGGTGTIGGVPGPFDNVVCRCGGIGWLPAGTV
ncbi:MAG: hypothetical protein IPI67_20985 [Myxococcales bacterium]|nr:hypothetical protein [Myxococcales bacterium]